MYNELPTKEIVNEIMKRIVYDYFGEDDVKESYLNNIQSAWEDFIDEQKTGDSEEICNFSLIGDLPGVEIVSGEIEVDYPVYEEGNEYDEESDDFIEVEKENYKVIHTWVKINNEIFEFSKGTLVDYIDWDDIYDINAEDISRYNEF